MMRTEERSTESHVKIDVYKQSTFLGRRNFGTIAQLVEQQIEDLPALVRLQLVPRTNPTQRRLENKLRKGHD